MDTKEKYLTTGQKNQKNKNQDIRLIKAYLTKIKSSTNKYQYQTTIRANLTRLALQHFNRPQKVQNLSQYIALKANPSRPNTAWV